LKESNRTTYSGTVSVRGYFNLQGDKLAGGNFTVDMPTLTSTDLSGDLKTKRSLEIRRFLWY
jgi:type 1 fimbria pilin